MSETENVIVFLRHGQGPHNVAFEATGETDHSVFESRSFFDCTLTDVGVSQCSAVRDALASRGLVFPAVASSPLRRALETACIVASDVSSPRRSCEMRAHDGLAEHPANHPCNTRAPRASMAAAFPRVDFLPWCAESAESADAAVADAVDSRVRIRAALIDLFTWVRRMPSWECKDGSDPTSRPALLVVSHFGVMSTISQALGLPMPREPCGFFVTSLEAIVAAFDL
jgi:broad specificity phosphatase PhoE